MWTLDCATNATGSLHKLSIEDLERVDAGYGYTFDDGVTFPFRGKGFRISRLEEFYNRYPGYKFWLNLKNNDERSFSTLYTYIANMPPSSRDTVIITTSKGMEWFRKKNFSVSVASADSVKSCGIDYLLIGWAGVVPDSCRDTILFIPPSMEKYFWGYPKRLAARLQKNGSSVYLWFRHEPVDPAYTNVVADGIGIITSDLDFVEKIYTAGRSN